MKKNQRQILFLTLLLMVLGINGYGQVLSCNANTIGTLDENGTITIFPEDILEGGPYDYSVLEVFNSDTGEGGEFLDLDCDDIGTFTIQVISTVTGNSCSGNFVLEDKLNPIPYAQNITVSMNGGNAVTVLPSMVDAGSVDNCNITSMVLSQSTFTVPGTYNVVFTVEDQSGNSDFATVAITVIEGSDPACYDLLTVSLNFEGEALVYAETFIEGNVDYDLIEVSLDNVNFGESVSFDCDDVGSPITVYVHVEEDGTDYECSSQVMIEDILAPIAIVESDFTINLESESDTYTLTIDEIDMGSYDNCSDIELQLSQTELTIEDWGQNQIVLTVTDAGGNTSAATTLVTVWVDGQAPPLECISMTSVVAEIWGPVQVWGADFVVNYEDYDEILASLDPAGPYAEYVSVDCGDNDDYPITLYIKAIEGQEEYDCFVDLSIIDNIAPIAITKIDYVLTLVNGSATLLPEMIDNGSHDNCTDVELSLSKTMFTTADIGENTVILTVTDENGNFNSTYANVIVTDGSGCDLGSVQMPANLTIYDNDGTYDDLSIENLQSNYGYTYEEVHPYIVSECEGIAYAFDDVIIDLGSSLKVIRKWTALDWFTANFIKHTQIIKLNITSNSLVCNDQVILVGDEPVTVWPSDVLEGGPYDYNNMTLSIVDSDDQVVEDNIITVDYIGQTLTYTVTNITTGSSCLGTLIIEEFIVSDDLTFVIPTITVASGASFCIPLTVYNFDEVQAGGGTILWDSSVISYSGLTNVNLPGVEGSLNETNSENGELKFVWSNPNPVEPLSIPDGGAIFELCFDAVGTVGAMSSITMSTTGELGFEWHDDLEVIPQELINGKITISDEQCMLEDENVIYPLANITLPELDLDPEILTPQYLVENYQFELSDVQITWDSELDYCLLIGQSIENDVFDYGDGSFKIIRTFTIVDWYNYIPGSTVGIWSFTQVINAGIDPESLICDFLPRTADVGDCESGHTLDDDVEWPADLEIADYRISPEELVEFSMVDVLDSKPSFYNNEDDYEASNIDLLIEINTTSLTLGRLWTVNHVLYDFTWTYSQTIIIDFSDFSDLVNINTGTNRAMPGVMINDAFSTDMQGDAYVDEPLVNSISYEDEYLNGVNILDMILIKRHISGLDTLKDYERIAADINHDEKISSSDITDLGNIVIGAVPVGKGDWTFQKKEIESPLSVEPKGIYVGVKAGDVDDSALLSGETAPDPDSKFEVLDILLNKGENYTIPVYLQDRVDAFGVEFHAQINTDLLEILEVKSAYEEFDISHYVSEEGTLSFTFDSFEESFEIGGQSSDPVFTVEVQAKENSLLSLALNMENHQSYIASSELELVVLGGEIGNVIGTATSDVELSLLSVYPNPTVDFLNIDLSNVGVRGDIEVSIFDQNGKRISNHFNNQSIDVTDFTAGMYYYHVRIDKYSTTGKFLVVR